MNVRIASLAGLLLVVALAACNGTPPSGGMIPTPAPVIVPTPTVGPGSTFAYSGSLTQTNTYAYPQPSPLPSTVNTAAVTENVVVSTSPAPPPLSAPASALDYNASETDAYGLQSVVTTTDSWQGKAAAGSAVNLVQYATNVVTNANTSTASTIATSYSTPQIVGQTPATAGASWKNVNGGTVTENDADGTTDVTKRNANGTYTDTQTIASTPQTLTIATKADGSGSYGGTALSSYGIQEFQMLAPASGKITVQILPTGGGAPTVVATPKAWFSAATPPYSDVTNVATNVTFPAACNVPPQFGTSGSSLTRQIASYDPVLGFTDAQTITTYVGGYGPVCIVLSDLQTTYYDYLNDTLKAWQNFADFEGTPLATQTIAETLTLQNATSASASRRSSAAIVAGAQGLSPSSVSFATAQFEARVQHERTVRRKAAIARLIRFMQHRTGGNVR